jgi:DNA ligase-1
MKAFALLLDRLSYSPSRNAKLRLIESYLRAAPDPDRGWALAALTDGLPISLPFRRIIGEALAGRIDEGLYRLSRDYVGDTAETVALLWPAPAAAPPTDASDAGMRLCTIVAAIAAASPREAPALLAGWLDRLDVTGRWALLKLLTGALRVGVSARLAKTALAAFGSVEPDAIEEVWHGVAPPYAELFAWLEGRGGRPSVEDIATFRPMMLAHPLEDGDLAGLDMTEFQAEWKWDGVRIQIAAARAGLRLFSRTGDDISASFPDLVEAWSGGRLADCVLDGELLILREGTVAPFNDLQQRLNRKAVTRRMLEQYPAHVRLYDALILEGRDLRTEPLVARRVALDTWHPAQGPPRTSLSQVLDIADKASLEQLWAGAREAGIEGLMLKRRESPYLAGRPKGHWYKWKRAALTLDCVLMYAQRGSGKRSSYYSDYTFGAWSGDQLVPVGKAYSGFTDEELLALDRWVREHTRERFGPVRSVEAGLVLEVAFDAVHRSSRHKSGVAMRFPRIHRIRWDKPAAEADRLETLLAMMPG